MMRLKSARKVESATDMTPETAHRASETWPALPHAEWRDTYATLHQWTQIVGKIRMALTPLVNHWWNVPLYVSSRGLTTSLIPNGPRAFQIDFDFVKHRVLVKTSDDRRGEFALEPMSVARFYRTLLEILGDLDIDVSIWPYPVEIPGDVVAFSEQHAEGAYDRQYVERLHRILVQLDRVFSRFRSGFIGKSSPVHFFWGAFDLAQTRFSGRTAPRHPGGVPNVGDHVMHEAYSHEVSSAGFWPGSGVVDEAAFYAYAYPEPDGFATQPIQPDAAYYHPEMREFILPYEAVRSDADPGSLVMQFLDSTYAAVATLGGWDRSALERSR